MAKLSGNKARIYIDEFAFSGYVNSVGMNLTQETPDVTTLSDTGPRRVVGNYDHTHSNNGFFDGAAASFDATVAALLDDDLHYQLVNYGAGVEGTVCLMAPVRLASKPVAASNGAATALNITTEGSGQMARGVLLRSATVTGTGSGTGQNTGATVSGQEYVVEFRVISGTFTGITIVVEESSDNAGADPYAAIAGLTSGALSAAGVVRVSTTAATEAWKRVTVSAFTGTDAVIVVAAGLVAGA